MNELIEKIEQWGYDRGIIGNSDTRNGQLEKLYEEVDELVEAYRTGDKDGEIDAVGDIVVVLVMYCGSLGVSLQNCLECAYEEIKDRKGKMVDGVFVKEK